MGKIIDPKDDDDWETYRPLILYRLEQAEATLHQVIQKTTTIEVEQRDIRHDVKNIRTNIDILAKLNEKESTRLDSWKEEWKDLNLKNIATVKILFAIGFLTGCGLIFIAILPFLGPEFIKKIANLFI